MAPFLFCSQKYFTMPLSLDTLRVGHTYRIANFGEKRDFTVERKLTDHDYEIKDCITQEKMQLSELIVYGTGKDFELDEIDEQGNFI